MGWAIGIYLYIYMYRVITNFFRLRLLIFGKQLVGERALLISLKLAFCSLCFFLGGGKGGWGREGGGFLNFYQKA